MSRNSEADGEAYERVNGVPGQVTERFNIVVVGAVFGFPAW